jgi:hypothetical protein
MRYNRAEDVSCPKLKCNEKKFGFDWEPLLDAMRVSYVTRTEDVGMAITGAVKSMNSMQYPVGVLLSAGILF